MGANSLVSKPTVWAVRFPKNREEDCPFWLSKKEDFFDEENSDSYGK
jgi:hypothetical protein